MEPVQYLSLFYTFIHKFRPAYTMVRYLPVKTEKEDIKEGFYSIIFMTLFVGLIALGILILFSNQIALVLFDGNTSVSILLAVGTVISVMSVSFLPFLEHSNRLKVYSILQLAQTYLGVAMVAFFVYSGISSYRGCAWICYFTVYRIFNSNGICNP